MGTVQSLIQRALSEVGYLEKASNANLDSKTGNAGSANYTKYARDMDAISDFYNTKKNGFSWCDVFVDWNFVKEFGVTEALRLLCQPKKSMGAGCEQSASYYMGANRWYKTGPQVGDQVFFRSKSYAFAHTGLVVEVTSSQVITVEGNTSGASGVIANGGGVCKKAYSLNDPNIAGYGRPDWTAAEKAGITEAKATQAKKYDNISMPEISFGASGDEVKTLQIQLNGRGFPCGSVDGEWGVKTDEAVAAFQQKNGLLKDRIVGKETWKKLLGAK